MTAEQAVIAIKALINGEYDNPYLESIGALASDKEDDILRIVDMVHIGVQPYTLAAIEKNISKLPDYSYAYDSSRRVIGIVRRGQSGYYPQYHVTIPEGSTSKEIEWLVRKRNERINVTPAQAEAMKSGAMYGWDVPAADVDTYKNWNFNA